MNRFRLLWGWVSQIKHRLSCSVQVFNGNSRSSELCCLIIIHAFCRYITGWTKRKMLDMFTCDFHCVICGVPTACIKWPGACEARGQFLAGWTPSVRRGKITLQCCRYRLHTQKQNQASLWLCKSRQCQNLILKSHGNCSPGQPTSLSSLGGPFESQYNGLPRFHFKENFLFSFFFLFKYKQV